MEKGMSNDDRKLFFYIFGPLFLGVVVIGYFAVQEGRARRAECEAKGGIYFSPRDGSICVEKNSVIPLNK